MVQEIKASIVITSWGINCFFIWITNKETITSINAKIILKLSIGVSVSILLKIYIKRKDNIPCNKTIKYGRSLFVVLFNLWWKGNNFSLDIRCRLEILERNIPNIELTNVRTIIANIKASNNLENKTDCMFKKEKNCGAP